MIKFRSFFFVIVLILGFGCSMENSSQDLINYSFNPEKYICYTTNNPINIDGKLDESDWERCPWTNKFVDIEGDKKPKPTYETKAKMLWDSNYLYIAAILEEPHIWASLKQRDTVIFYDNDFEVFIDPNSDSHEYYELEVNAYGTEWDLMLTKPYRDNGRAIDHWDINGLKTGIDIKGTINNPNDIDTCWTIELAIPWDALKECAYTSAPPENNNQWRFGFSRVEWQTESINGKYQKTINPETNKPFPENNWVWSPQGVIAMHQPETWGIVQFSTNSPDNKVHFYNTESYEAAYILYQLFYQQKNFFKRNKKYENDIKAFKKPNFKLRHYTWPPDLSLTINGYEIYWESDSNEPSLLLNHEGKLQKLRNRLQY